MKHLAILFCASVSFLACQSPVKNVTTVMLDDTEMTVCDESKISQTKETKLSELVEDFQIIRFENTEEAFFKPSWLYFSDNYICIRQDGNAVKLFNKAGKFISDIGKIGQGPGEYRFVYDVAIDEKNQSIYLTSLVGESILKYNLKGEYVREINLGERLNKPRLFIQPDSTLSLVQLCFKDLGNKFTGTNVQTLNNDSIQYIYVPALVTHMRNKSENNVGLNNEIWSYRNTPDFPFMMTHTDTLYHYNSKRNEIKACFTMQMAPEKKGNAFFIFNELPHHYVVLVIGENGKTILVDKARQEAYETKIVNDYMGNLAVSPKFQDGYYFRTYEPLDLKEMIEEHLASGNCPEEQVEKLKAFQETLRENDNNLLLLGKLKK